MNVGRWVEHLADKGIRLEADHDRIRVRAAKGAIDDADRAALSSRKAELLAYLTSRSAIEPLTIVPRDAELPLSFAQQRLWFLACVGNAGEAYGISAALRLEGVLNQPALERSLSEIVRRHEVLRTRIIAVDGRAVQHIDPPSPIILRCETLSELAEPDAEASRRACEFVNVPFDLTAGPLFRARLWRTGPLRHVLAVAVHHIVFDGWSLKVLMHELSKLYAAFSIGQLSPFSDLPVQYADYAAWQRRCLTDKRVERQATYWRHHLTGAPAQSTIPSDRPRPAAATTRGGAVRFEVPRAVAQAIRALARQAQATPFMALLAAWSLLLSRMSGQDDVVVGCPVANRGRQELEPLLGLFANILALRFDVSEGATLGAFLERVRTTTLAAYDQQDMPFEQVVDAVEPERQMHHHPLFQTVFVLQSAVSRIQLDLPGLAVTALPLDVQSAKFDLTLEVTENADGFAAVLEYNSDLYEHGTAGAIAARWLVLLKAMAQPGAAELPLHKLPVMTPAEREKLIWDWGSNPRAYRREHTISAAFAERAGRNPDAIAVSCGEHSLTYRGLDERANRLAHHLLATSRVGPDVLVGLAVERSIDLIVALLGILKAGAAYMPLDPADPPRRLSFMVADDVPLLVTTRALDARLPTGPARVYVDTDAQAIARQEASAPASEAGPASLAYVLYTSGSTGEPKGVLVEQRSVMRLVDNAGYAALGPESVVLHLAPLSFDASTFEIWGPLLNGGRLVVMEPGTPTLEEIGAAIRRYGVNTLWLTAGLFQAMVDERLEDFAPLRQLLVGGDVVSPAHVARVLAAHAHLTVVNGYGPTETTTFAACHAVRADELPNGRVPIGRPIGNTHVYVRDRHGELLPPGAPGELFIGGDGVARHYRKRPDLSAERFLPDPWRPGERVYRTGDLVRWRADGVLEFLGRLDDQVKVRGFRVELGDVETAILTHPDVAAAAVTVHMDTKGGKQLAAYVVPRAGVDLRTRSLAGWLEDRLPTYSRPQHWQVLAEIPLTVNGKIDRDRLPAPHAQAASGSAVAPRTLVERTLAEIWVKLLDRRDIGIDDNFFELGGDSILSLQIVARCREAGLKILPRQIFEHQTIAELAPHVIGDPDATDAVDQHPLSGPVAPGPIQKWFYALQLREPHHFNQSVLLVLAPEIDASVLRQALASLIRHHDMLRLRVADGGLAPRQWIASPDDEVPLDIVPPFEQVEHDRMARTLARAQASLDLEKGPILRALLFPAGSGRTARLLLVIHHLAVDGVSWRILLEDLETACEAVLGGRPVALPRKTLAFPHWVERLEAHAQTEAARRDLAYWQAMPVSDGLKDMPAAALTANFVGTAQKVQRVLAPALTRDLLQKSPRAYNTRVEDALLTALLLSHFQLSRKSRLRIDLEGYGRDSFDPTLDLSRTVGWFSCLYPVDLVLENESLRDALVHVKEQLRRVPGNGLAYALGRWMMPRAGIRLPAGSGIVFNYLGQFDQMLTRTRLIRVSEESSGPNQGPSNRRSCLIEILSMVFDGSLRVEWHYHPACHSRQHIETWADHYMEALAELVDHCCNSENGGYTPADFPSVALGLAELERIQALAAASLPEGAP
jgi:amino acid adenylation domain-containing protein/non-ribosomal peptide synthase protein (TIGR01720 family)